MVEIWMMLAKIAASRFLKLTFFGNKGYDFIFSIHDVTIKILLRYSNYTVDVVMCPKFRMREVIIT